MGKFIVAQIPSGRAVKRNFKHSKLKLYTVCIYSYSDTRQQGGLSSQISSHLSHQVHGGFSWSMKQLKIGGPYGAI